MADSHDDGALKDGGAVVRTTGLSKRFRHGELAVDHVDLQVPAGAVYGFLGPNGSGKTTTIRMLLGLVRPSAGEAELLGAPMPRSGTQVLPRVGALVEGPALQPYLSGHANLQRLDAVDASADPATRAARIGKALERVGLTGAAGKRFRQYSLGMKQRLGLAAALLRPRDLLVLDEPTNGLDPQGTREVRSLIREVSREGTTVLVSSHLLSEIDQVCTHLGVMSKGKLLAQGPRAQFSGSRGNRLELETVAESGSAARAALAGLGLTSEPGPEHLITARLGDLNIGAVAPALVAAEVPILRLTTREPTLEDIFVELTGEGFDVTQ
ncbi:MAG: ATP-binding cassette domain-containing protein [Beutenbergiaceae bacterium]